MKRKQNGKYLLILGVIGIIFMVCAITYLYDTYENPTQGYTPQEIAETGIKPVNINTASAEEIAALPAVSRKMAQRIVDYRTQNGDFQSTDELLKVKGFRKAAYRRIVLYITV